MFDGGGLLAMLLRRWLNRIAGVPDHSKD